MDLKALFQQAIAAHQAGDLAQASGIYAQLLVARPGHPQVLYLLGGLFSDQGRHAEALPMLQLSAKANPDFAPVHLNLGNALQGLNRFDEAVAAYDRALALKSDFSDAANNKGNALSALGRFDDALSSFDAALALDPGNAGAWYNRGTMLLEKMLAYDAALASFDRALAIRSDYSEALNNKSHCLLAMKQPARALAGFEASLAIQPGNPLLLLGRGAALMALNRFGEALAVYEQVVATHDDQPTAWGQLAMAALYECDWQRMRELETQLPRLLDSRSAIVSPLVMVSYSQDGALIRKVAERAVQSMPRLSPGPLRGGARPRIGYVSPDFCAHPVGVQLVQLLECHDHENFEIVGISTGPDDGSALRARIVTAFDEFHDFAGMGPEELARAVKALNLDIAMDLSGHTADQNLAAFARRIAPVQASWLGYPGTTGADFMDYIIGDAIVTPHEQQDFYAEKIVQLPDTFFPMDSSRAIGTLPSRAELGLPETGFVFCCFNKNWKIDAPVFDVWMRLLKAVPDSVLWLKEFTPNSRAALEREAKARSVDPARLVFAGSVSSAAEHLARHRMADLFLDTLPYNAHATAADALLAGLPVLTCRGAIYAGRVGASLLTAAGLPELITDNLEDYEQTALALARDPARQKALKDKLASNRASAPLFDTARFARNLETAYLKILEKA